MATTKNATYKVYNGTDWDTIYFATSAAQVGESSTLKFLRPSVNKVNGKAFTTSTGITLYAGDIDLSSSDSTKISSAISARVKGSFPFSTTVGTIMVTNGADTIKDSGKTFEETLTYANNKVPTSSAVKDYVDSAVAGAISPTDLSVSGVLEVGSQISMAAEDGIIYCADVITNKDNTANGLLRLGSDGKIASTYLPSYVDDVLEYAYDDSFPSTGEAGKIYVDKHNNKTYRWGGSSYVEISASLALGETSSTAYAGDKGKANAANIATLQSNVSTLQTTVSGHTTNISTLFDHYDTLSPRVSNLESGTTPAGKATQLATARKFTIGATGKDFNGTAALTWTLAEINAYVRQVFEGSTTPTGMRSGDIWLQYS